MDTTHSSQHIVLVPGFWLGAWAWDAVVGPLRAAGLTPHPVTLPGLEPEADCSGIGREEHVRAVLELLESLEGEVVLVGHSGGGALVQQVADRAPERVRRVVFVDTGPLVDGARLHGGLEPEAVELPFPSWEELAANGSSVEGIDEAGLERLRSLAVPQPAGVAREPVRVSNPARLSVPATVVCTSIPSHVLREIASPGPPFHTELLEWQELSWVDLPTGHWPMLSRPAELAAVLVEAARA